MRARPKANVLPAIPIIFIVGTPFARTAKIGNLVPFESPLFKQVNSLEIHFSVQILVHIQFVPRNPVTETRTVCNGESIKTHVIQRETGQIIQVFEEFCNRLPRQVEHEIAVDLYLRLHTKQFKRPDSFFYGMMPTDAFQDIAMERLEPKTDAPYATLAGKRYRRLVARFRIELHRNFTEIMYINTERAKSIEQTHKTFSRQQRRSPSTQVERCRRLQHARIPLRKALHLANKQICIFKKKPGTGHRHHTKIAIVANFLAKRYMYIYSKHNKPPSLAFPPLLGTIPKNSFRLHENLVI